jgi:hypothetical protein
MFVLMDKSMKIRVHWELMVKLYTPLPSAAGLGASPVSHFDRSFPVEVILGSGFEEHELRGENSSHLSAM